MAAWAHQSKRVLGAAIVVALCAGATGLASAAAPVTPAARAMPGGGAAGVPAEGNHAHPAHSCAAAAKRHGRRPCRARSRHQTSPSIVEEPVSFTVQNVNRTSVACPSDGRTYTISGLLAAPRSALAPGSSRRAVTLYIAGSVIGATVWHFPDPSSDWVAQEARAGHVSVVIDQLGFGRSGLPDGSQVCVGSWADTDHQVIQALRSGRYSVSGGSAVRFSRVALASYCVGGIVGQVEAYTFKDIDAFIEVSSAFDQGQSSAATTDFATNPNGPVLVCARGGEPKFPGGPPWYSYVLKGSEARLWLYNTAPAVVDYVISQHEREPCAEGPSVVAAVAADQVHMREISVPVLLVFGNQDAIFPPPDGTRQEALYSGSHDVSLVQLDQAGHALQIGRTAPAARAAVSEWLKARGF